MFNIILIEYIYLERGISMENKFYLICILTLLTACSRTGSIQQISSDNPVIIEKSAIVFDSTKKLDQNAAEIFDLGTVSSNGTIQKTFTLSNLTASNITLNFTDLKAKIAATTRYSSNIDNGSSCSTSLKINKTCSFQLTLTGNSQDSFDAITTNIIDSSSRGTNQEFGSMVFSGVKANDVSSIIPLSGILRIDRLSDSYVVSSNKSLTKRFYLGNIGTASLKTPTVIAPQDGVISLNTCSAISSIKPNGTCFFEITYNYSSDLQKVHYSTKVTFVSNDPLINTSGVEINLAIENQLPLIPVISANITQVGLISDLTIPTSKTRLYVSNTGSSSLDTTTITIPSPYVIDSQTCSAQIKVGKTCYFDLKLDTQLTANMSAVIAQIVIGSNSFSIKNGDKTVLNQPNPTSACKVGFVLTNGVCSSPVVQTAGVLNKSFGQNGVALIPYSQILSESVDSISYKNIALDSNDNVYIGSVLGVAPAKPFTYSYYGETSYCGYTRYFGGNPDLCLAIDAGTIFDDASFESYCLATGDSMCYPNPMFNNLIQNPNEYDVAIAKMSAQGSVDSSFGNGIASGILSKKNGIVKLTSLWTKDSNNPTPPGIGGLAVLPDNSLLISAAQSSATAKLFNIPENGSVQIVGDDLVSSNIGSVFGYTSGTMYEKIKVINNKIYIAQNGQVYRLNSDFSLDSAYSNLNGYEQIQATLNQKQLNALSTENNISENGFFSLNRADPLPYWWFVDPSTVLTYELIRYNQATGITTTTDVSSLFSNVGNGVISAFPLNDGSILAFALGEFIKIKTDGQVDSTFGVNGKLDLWRPINLIERPLAVFQDSNQNIFIAAEGLVNPGQSLGASVVKISNNGVLDDQFGTHGAFLTPATEFNFSVQNLQSPSLGAVLDSSSQNFIFSGVSGQSVKVIKVRLY
jgi:hypothetical protein